jgi:hypothetical protein
MLSAHQSSVNAPGKPVLYHIFTSFVPRHHRAQRGGHSGNDDVFWLTALLFAIFVLHLGQPGPWPQIAAQIRTSGSPVEPVVFESQPSGTYGSGGEFPNGFFRVPFDFYFHGNDSGGAKLRRRLAD